MTRKEFEIALRKIEPQRARCWIRADSENWSNLHIAAAMVGLIFIHVKPTEDWLPEFPWESFWFPPIEDPSGKSTECYYVIPAENYTL